jgi:hypothetical protein
MQDDLNQLYEIEGRLNEAVIHLREQQHIVDGLDSTISGTALISLLSSGLRHFSWLERERESLGRKIIRSLPPGREGCFDGQEPMPAVDFRPK